MIRCDCSQQELAAIIYVDIGLAGTGQWIEWWTRVTGAILQWFCDSGNNEATQKNRLQQWARCYHKFVTSVSEMRLHTVQPLSTPANTYPPTLLAKALQINGYCYFPSWAITSKPKYSNLKAESPGLIMSLPMHVQRERTAAKVHLGEAHEVTDLTMLFLCNNVHACMTLWTTRYHKLAPSLEPFTSFSMETMLPTKTSYYMQTLKRPGNKANPQLCESSNWALAGRVHIL